ncbi:hypothetical protein EHS25_002703 [Saitozyma podzolica]|uniref:Uncharacterized protein n=1 Tax=Saitozyma podzolica TaxID=1890683 RepID=A0A427YD06_9TREE|nr:hypothetical protein EHS25_002703 [Saitozyma podzolica]
MSGSVHRLKLSPAKERSGRGLSSSPSKDHRGSPLKSVAGLQGDEPADEVLEADTSFTGRLSALSRAVTGRPVPRPSTTLAEAQQALATAAKHSKSAAEDVELSQQKWMDALIAFQAHAIQGGKGVGQVVREGWGWGRWGWWVLMEVVLMWGVFRVTLDYATSAYYPSDPLNPSHPGGYALSIPLPSAISAFVVPHRGSANFFDVLESLHLWSRLEAVGVVTQVAGGEGYVPVGGMRWVEEGVRMWGGVPS